MRISRLIVYSFMGILIFILSIVGFLFLHDKYFYNPISEQQYDMMFRSYKQIRKNKTVNVLGLDFHGAIYDISEYLITEPIINYDFPTKDNLYELGYINPPDYYCQWKKCSDFKREFIPIMNKGKDHMTQKLLHALSIADNLYCMYNYGNSEVFCAVFDIHTNILYYLQVDM